MPVSVRHTFSPEEEKRKEKERKRLGTAVQQDAQVVRVSFFRCIMEKKKKEWEKKPEKWGEFCVTAVLHNRPRSFPSQKKVRSTKGGCRWRSGRGRVEEGGDLHTEGLNERGRGLVSKTGRSKF